MFDRNPATGEMYCRTLPPIFGTSSNPRHRIDTETGERFWVACVCVLHLPQPMRENGDDEYTYFLLALKEQTQEGSIVYVVVDQAQLLSLRERSHTLQTFLQGECAKSESAPDPMISIPCTLDRHARLMEGAVNWHLGQAA